MIKLSERSVFALALKTDFPAASDFFLSNFSQHYRVSVSQLS
jgi:hypothetical protein